MEQELIVFRLQIMDDVNKDDPDYTNSDTADHSDMSSVSIGSYSAKISLEVYDEDAVRPGTTEDAIPAAPLNSLMKDDESDEMSSAHQEGSEPDSTSDLRSIKKLARSMDVAGDTERQRARVSHDGARQSLRRPEPERGQPSDAAETGRSQDVTMNAAPEHMKGHRVKATKTQRLSKTLHDMPVSSGVSAFSIYDLMLRAEVILELLDRCENPFPDRREWRVPFYDDDSLTVRDVMWKVAKAIVAGHDDPESMVAQAGWKSKLDVRWDLVESMCKRKPAPF
jgi:hypothetical protein